MRWCSDIYFWRQGLILISDILYSIGVGFMLTFSSVLNPALLSNSTDIRASIEEVAWISASLGFSGLIGFAVMPLIFQCFGRIFTHIVINCVLATGFLMFYFAQNTTDLFIGKVVQGLATSGMTLTAMLLAEYSDPERRGYFITSKKTSISLGIFLCHSLYFACSWRQIALIGVLPLGASAIITLFWPESPAYLAMKGKYDKCGEAHTWLFGDSQKSRRNLEKLIAVQLERRNKRHKNVIENMKFYIGQFFAKSFLKPFLIALLLTLAIEASGRYYMMLYFIQIAVEITGDTSIGVYVTLIADLFMLIALSLSGYLVRVLKRRSIIINFGLASAVLMYLISIFKYLKTAYNIGERLTWLIPLLVVLNASLCYLAVIPVGFAIVGEIFPLEHKGIGSFSSGIVLMVYYIVTAKYTPAMIRKTGVKGLFAIFATCLLISIIGLYFCLVETKDKSLQDIEDEIKDVKKEQSLLDDKNTVEA